MTALDDGAGMTGGDIRGLTARDRLLAVRDRLVASPRFRAWAAATPFTRPIARQRTRALFDLCAGFVYSQVLYACVELHLFDILAEGPQPLPPLAARLGLPPPGAERLLRAAVSLRLVSRRAGGRFGLGPLGAAMVGNAGIAEMVRHHRMLYADLADPVALLRGEARGTALSSYWAYSGNPGASALGGEVAAYTALMAASQPLVAGEILAAYPVRRHRLLMDVGGGDGSFLLAVAAQAPALRLRLFDLPPVAGRAAERFTTAGLGSRAEATGGDFLDGALPPGADLVSLVRVVHDHDDDAALRILRAAHAALPPGGTLLLAEPMSDTPGAEPVGDAYFGFYLMAMGQGRTRTPAELTAMLHAAGFGSVRRHRTHTPLLVGVLSAVR
jgi:demethylspheroidene O-methyltransferase